jgi:hypothetical protein
MATTAPAPEPTSHHLDRDTLAFTVVVVVGIIAGGIGYLVGRSSNVVPFPALPGENGLTLYHWYWLATSLAVALIVACFGLWSMRASRKDDIFRHHLKEEIHETRVSYTGLRSDAERALYDTPRRPDISPDDDAFRHDTTSDDDTSSADDMTSRQRGTQ